MNDKQFYSFDLKSRYSVQCSKLMARDQRGEREKIMHKY